MKGLTRLSIRTVVSLLIGVMGLLLVGMGGNAMREAIHRNAAAGRIALLTEASQSLFKALLPARDQRGIVISALGGANPIDAGLAADLAVLSRTSDDNYAQGIQRLTSLGQTSLVARLDAAHGAADVMQSTASAAMRQPRPARDPALAADYAKVTQSLLDTMVAASDQLEASLQLVDPEVDHFLAIKRAAWATRLYLGVMDQRTQAAVASVATLSPLEVRAWYEDFARAGFAWSQVTEAAARPDAAKALVDAAAAANRNFSGVSAQRRTGVVAALAAGQNLSDSTRDLSRLGTIDKNLVAAVANIALDNMVDRAHGQAVAAQWTLIVTGSILVVTLLLVVAGFVIAKRRVSGPIRAITQAMGQLADQDLSVAIPGLGRGDEVGAMAAALQVFKDNAIQSRATERDQAEAQARRAAEDERIRHHAEQAAAAAAAALVVGSIGKGLERLAAGDLTYRLSTVLPEAYEKLREDLNGTMVQLSDLVRTIVTNTSAIRTGTDEITQASDDLSRRTEQQAASLEQTAAALDEITATVRKTAEGARQARDVVNRTRVDAEQSGKVVREAVAAMSGIERSSQQITQIVGVIDEIAFQTNLLALNAGVEAARAGEAGRGFAVVASEVRALAQRSAQAAKEIKTLITTSARQVDAGVKLVGETGQALTRIVVQVGEVTDVVSEIAASAQEQATGLQEVNTAINQMDQVTQQNAAMVEQSTAASHSLAQETAELVRLTERFQVDDTGGAPVAARAAPLKVVNRSRRPALAGGDDGWTEF